MDRFGQIQDFESWYAETADSIDDESRIALTDNIIPHRKFVELFHSLLLSQYKAHLALVGKVQEHIDAYWRLDDAGMHSLDRRLRRALRNLPRFRDCLTKRYGMPLQIGQILKVERDKVIEFGRLGPFAKVEELEEVLNRLDMRIFSEIQQLIDVYVVKLAKTDKSRPDTYSSEYAECQGHYERRAGQSQEAYIIALHEFENVDAQWKPVESGAHYMHETNKRLLELQWKVKKEKGSKLYKEYKVAHEKMCIQYQCEQYMQAKATHGNIFPVDHPSKESTNNDDEDTPKATPSEIYLHASASDSDLSSSLSESVTGTSFSRYDPGSDDYTIDDDFVLFPTPP